MADVKMCDRCGKLIKLEGIMDNFGRAPDISKRKYRLAIKSDDPRSDYFVVDLCPKCYDKLVAFMEKEVKK